MKERSETERRKITVFGAETEFDGVLEFKDTLIITGKFTGKINAATGDLEIAKNAIIDVESMNINSVEISGTVKGDINASERVEIFSGSVVDSDIKTARLRIANNVDFKGKVSMLEKEPDIDLFSVVSSEFKKSMFVHSDIIK